MRQLLYTFVCFFALGAQVQSQESFSFKHKESGKIQTIGTGDYIKLYCKNVPKGNYKISGTFSSIVDDHIILKSSKFIPLKEIVKIRSQSPGARNGTIILTILLSILFLIIVALAGFYIGFIFIYTEPSAWKTIAEILLGITIFVSPYFLVLGAYNMSFSTNSKVMDHFQTDWILVLNTQP